MTTVAAVHEERIDSTKNIKIFVRSWQPPSPRAVVVICHGVNSHGGHYTWVGEQFAAAGCAAYALDLRGRGQSDGERFYVEDVADYVNDVAGTVKLGDQVVTDGGRVLGVTALGENVAQAKLRAYQAVKCIRWDGAWCRKDISDKAAQLS